VNDLQLRLNNCLRKTVVFNYAGKIYTANLNLTMNYMNSLKCENENFTEEDFHKVEKYLRYEGFFN
jgi:hypothetical protein